MLTTCFFYARLWQRQLEQCYPIWASAGVYPVPGRQDGQTWKALVVTASKLQELEVIQTGLTLHPVLEEKSRELWNSGM